MTDIQTTSTRNVDSNFTLELQIEAVRELMLSGVGMTQLLMPYYKKLLSMASRSGIEPSQRPPVEELD